MNESTSDRNSETATLYSIDFQWNTYESWLRLFICECVQSLNDVFYFTFTAWSQTSLEISTGD